MRQKKYVPSPLPLAVAAALALPAGPAAADMFDEVSFHGMLGLRVFDGDAALGNLEPGRTSIANSPIIGLRVEYPLLWWLAAEGETVLGITNSRDDSANLLFLDARAQARIDIPLDYESVTPFITAGVGLPTVLSDNQSGLESDIDGEFYGGAGIRYEKPGGFGLRFDFRAAGVRARGDQVLGAEFEFIFSIYRSNKPAPKIDTTPDVVAEKKVETPPDWDNDGLLNEKDQCPDRAEDKDGFEDEDGCPDIDNDFDQVLDVADKCPLKKETLNGFEDQDGCPDTLPPQVASLEGVLKIRFGSGGTAIPARIRASLSRTAQTLNAHPSVQLEIQGHTDNRGDETQNELLSQRRAEAVKAYLVKRGVEQDRLRAVGYGSRKPIASNDSRAGRLKNRRVQFVIIKPVVEEDEE